MTGRWARVAAGLALLVALAAAREVRAVEETPKELQGVGVVERLGAEVNGELVFTDHTGAKVRLGDLLDGERPVLLTLNYYRCTALCSLHLNGLVEGLRALDWAPGEGYRVVTVSIDPKESFALAWGKRQSYLEALDRGDVDWSFLVGAPEPVAELAASVGFGYEYDPRTDQFAHAAAVMLLSPSGKIVRYLYGIELPARDLKFAIMEAAEGRVGSLVDRIVMTCFHYDETLGRYGPFAFGIMRLGAATTVVVLALLLAVLWRRDRRRRLREQTT